MSPVVQPPPVAHYCHSSSNTPTPTTWQVWLPPLALHTCTYLYMMQLEAGGKAVHAVRVHHTEVLKDHDKNQDPAGIWSQDLLKATLTTEPLGVWWYRSAGFMVLSCIRLEFCTCTSCRLYMQCSTWLMSIRVALCAWQWYTYSCMGLCSGHMGCLANATHTSEARHHTCTSSTNCLVPHNRLSSPNQHRVQEHVSLVHAHAQANYLLVCSWTINYLCLYTTGVQSCIPPPHT